MSAAVVELASVTVGYGPRTILEHIDLRVSPGDMLVVLGPNGAGKTTLLRVLAGTVVPRSGTVMLDGRAMRSLDRTAIARRIAVVPQEVPIAEGFSVGEIVMMGRAPHQGGWLRATDRDHEKVEDALARCTVAALRDRPFAALSGGERKRVMVAQALAQEPALLLLDEPSAFLDLKHTIDIFELVAAEAARGLAVVANVHDFALAARYGTRAAVLLEGRMVAHGPVDEVIDAKTLGGVFGVPLASPAGPGLLVPERWLQTRSGR